MRTYQKTRAARCRLKQGEVERKCPAGAAQFSGSTLTQLRISDERELTFLLLCAASCPHPSMESAGKDHLAGRQPEMVHGLCARSCVVIIHEQITSVKSAIQNKQLTHVEISCFELSQVLCRNCSHRHSLAESAPIVSSVGMADELNDTPTSSGVD